jgi:N-acetylneuraminic acid mutarotase
MFFIYTLIISWNLQALGPPRSGHSTVNINNELFLFGGLVGSAGSATSNELWKFAQNKWQNQTTHYGPSRRMYSASASIDDHMYIFGGWDPGEAKSGGSFFNDAWKLNTGNNEWTQIDNMPYQTSRHTACAIDNKIILITHKDTIVFENDQYIVQETSGDAPHGLSMACSVANNTLIYFFGGSTHKQELSNSVYSLCTRTWKWNKFVNIGEVPEARASSCATVFKDKCIVYGGGGIKSSYKQGLTGFDDIYEFTVIDKYAIWEKLNTTTDTAGKVGASMNLLNQKRLLLHGGWNPETMTTFSETLSLEIT